MENPEFRSDENYEFATREDSRDSIKLENIPRDSIEASESRHSKCSAGHLSVQSDHSRKGFLSGLFIHFTTVRLSLMKVMYSPDIQKHQKFQMFHQ